MTALPDVLTQIQQAPQGLTLADLLSSQPALARRTAQRQIAQLIDHGQIQAQGEGRARRYFASTTPPDSKPKPRAQPATDIPRGIAWSADTQDIQAYLNQPLTDRPPVDYQFQFLADYQPNQSSYWSASLRRQLHQMGKTADLAQPAGTHIRRILPQFVIDLSWSSSRLDGCSYSRSETQALFEQGLNASPKASGETQWLLNHQRAIALLIDQIDTSGFSLYPLLNLHSALAENLLANPADEGRIRQQAVDLPYSRYRPLASSTRLAEQLALLLNKASQIQDPFEQSLFMLVQLAYLQAFADLNQPLARLLANLPLLRANLCPLIFIELPEPAYRYASLGLYEMTRIELLRDLYLKAYERSSQAYLVIRQDLAEPEPLRSSWRDLIRNSIRQLVQEPQLEPLDQIQAWVTAAVPEPDQLAVQALIIEELQRLHEGVLARYGLGLDEYHLWQTQHRP